MYVEAVDAHDFDTAGQLLTPEARRSFEQTWFEDVDSMTDLHVGDVSPEKSQWSGHKPGEQVVNVSASFNLQWRWLHNDGSMDEGPTTWGYLLVLDSTTGTWRIFSQGTG